MKHAWVYLVCGSACVGGAVIAATDSANPAWACVGVFANTFFALLNYGIAVIAWKGGL